MNRNDEQFKWLLESFNYIDSVTIIDNKGTIIYKKRFNPRFTDQENEESNLWATGKKLLEVFPSLDYSSSSLLQAIQTGNLIYYEGQSVLNSQGKETVTNNLTFPIISRGRIVGAVELSRDDTHIEKDLNSTIIRTNSKQRSEMMTAAYSLDDIITVNDRMMELKHMVEIIADSSSSVMVTGETGVGKELFVSSIHNVSKRKNKPFIAVNCAALPENILEGLLFGSRKGAFTGAENKKGMFEEANGGTIYLDEINSMPMMLQAKLLRVLQEKEVLPLGASKPIKLDVRIIASTNTSVSELLSEHKMRDDMLYRLSTIVINIPPLRERKDDIRPLTEHFVKKYNREFKKEVSGISEDAMKLFESRRWNGNVRELEHAVEAAVNVAESGEIIGRRHLSAYLIEEEHGQDMIPAMDSSSVLPLSELVDAFEREMIIKALNSCGNKIVDAAELLKIPRTSLQYKMQKYNITS